MRTVAVVLGLALMTTLLVRSAASDKAATDEGQQMSESTLARMSHTLPAATADSPAIATFLPAVAPATCFEHASAPPWSKRRADGRLHGLATKVCEICGLAGRTPASDLDGDSLRLPMRSLAASFASIDPPGGTSPRRASGRVSPVRDESPLHRVVLRVNVSGQVPGLSENETTVAMDPADPGHFVVASQHFDVADMANRWLGIYATFDGGETWSRVSPPGFPTPNGLTAYGADPVIVFGPGELLLSSTQAVSGDDIFNLGIAGVFLARSIDGGRSFGTDEPVATGYDAAGSEPRFFDKAWLTHDTSSSPWKGRLYAAYHYGSSTMAAMVPQLRYRDPGQPLSEPVTLTTESGYGLIPRVDRHGLLHVVWQSDPEGSDKQAIRYARSDDGGNSFGAPRDIAAFEPEPGGTIGGGLSFLNLPSFDIDRSEGPYRGALYVVYNTSTNGRDAVVLIRSSDGGDSWTQPAPISLQPSGNQFLQAVAVDEADGTVWVAFFDGRAAAESSAVDLYVVVSDDGGASFTLLKVTASPFDARSGLVAGYFIGDYMSIAARNGTAVVAYPDNRDGTYDLWVAVLE